MEIKDIADLILPAGVLYLGYQVLSNLGLTGSKPPTSDQVTAACPKGKEYTRFLFQDCEPNYVNKAFGSFPMDSCVCLGSADQPSTGSSGSLFDRIVDSVLMPSARSCEQAGYPPPCIKPDQPSSFQVIPGSPFDPCVTNPLDPSCWSRY